MAMPDRETFQSPEHRSSLEELMTKNKGASFGRLRYLYMGTSNVQKDVDYYTKALGASKVWDISSFGTRVAALQLGQGPLLLLADHRPAPSCILIFQVDDLQEMSKELRQKGWNPDGRTIRNSRRPVLQV
jgi:hypothetical protein